MTSDGGSVLVVDDDPAVGKVLAALLAQAGIACSHVPGRGARRWRRCAGSRSTSSSPICACPGRPGWSCWTRSRERWPEIPVILLTAHGSVGVAVDAMKRGAADFLLKPFDREEILFTVRKQIAAARHADRQPTPTDAAAGSVGSSSHEMREVQDLIRRAARGTVTVLVRGESGTGKELAARAIHDNGPRRDAPFVKIHCAALPDTLIESELFGYEKGAFTGAASRKPGRVELAEGGTLFLDEIGDVSPLIQVKLLRLLQDREFERLGSTQTMKSTARIVAATHQPLEELIEAAHVPRGPVLPAERVADLDAAAAGARRATSTPLATHFCRQFGAANGRGALAITPDALARLRHRRGRATSASCRTSSNGWSCCPTATA